MLNNDVLSKGRCSKKWGFEHVLSRSAKVPSLVSVKNVFLVLSTRFGFLENVYVLSGCPSL